QAINVARQRKETDSLTFTERFRRSDHSPSEIESDDGPRRVRRESDCDSRIRSTPCIEDQAGRTGERIGDCAQGLRRRKNRNVIVRLPSRELPNVAAKLDIQALDRRLVSG